MLCGLMRLLQAMLTSLSVDLEPSLHQLMPAVLTCVVGKRLCSSPLEDHWRLRHQAIHPTPNPDPDPDPDPNSDPDY